MKQYRKKPIVIEAVQYDGDNEFDIKDWAQGAITSPFTYGKNPPKLEIKTLEGVMTANIGDWIIKGVAGEFYPCKPDVFAATYEPVEPTTNCSQLGSKFTIKQVGKSEGYVIYRENEFIGGITFGNDKDVYVVARTRLSPSELRGLAGLVEDTLEGGE